MADVPSHTEIRTTEIVDLDEWIVAVGVTPEDQTADEIDQPVKAIEPAAATVEGQPFTLRQEAAVSWTQFRQSEQTQLAFSFG